MYKNEHHSIAVPYEPFLNDSLGQISKKAYLLIVMIKCTYSSSAIHGTSLSKVAKKLHIGKEDLGTVLNKATELGLIRIENGMVIANEFDKKEYNYKFIQIKRSSFIGKGFKKAHKQIKKELLIRHINRNNYCCITNKIYLSGDFCQKTGATYGTIKKAAKFTKKSGYVGDCDNYISYLTLSSSINSSQRQTIRIVKELKEEKRLRVYKEKPEFIEKISSDTLIHKHYFVSKGCLFKNIPNRYFPKRTKGETAKQKFINFAICTLEFEVKENLLVKDRLRIERIKNKRSPNLVLKKKNLIFICDKVV